MCGCGPEDRCVHDMDKPAGIRNRLDILQDEVQVTCAKIREFLQALRDGVTIEAEVVIDGKVHKLPARLRITP